MKKCRLIKITTVFFLFISSLISAQTNFFQTGATWGYSSLEHPDTPFDPYREWLEQSTLTGDTTINNLAYKKLHRHIKETDMQGNGGGIGNIVYFDYSTEYIRFDSLSKEVFYISDLNPIERLLYNFNLNIGDTVPNDSGIAPLIIDSIENISLFGYVAKKYFLITDTSQAGINPEQYIIEGIGGSNGLTILQPHEGFILSSYIVTDLLCFQLNNDVYPTGSVCDVFTRIKENDKNKFSVTVFPNPFQKSFHLNLSSPEKSMTFKIFDILGKEIYTKLIFDKEEINDFTPSGLFFWKLMKKEELISSGKLLHIEN